MNILPNRPWRHLPHLAAVGRPKPGTGYAGDYYYVPFQTPHQFYNYPYNWYQMPYYGYFYPKMYR